MKNVYCFSIFILILALFLGCTAGNVPVSDRLYTWEHDGFGGDFTITLYADGTFSYYEGMLSSYIGAGTWTEEMPLTRSPQRSASSFTPALQKRSKACSVPGLSQPYHSGTPISRMFILLTSQSMKIRICRQL